jgi:hypothetical protein
MPNLSTNGSISLNWTSVYGATYYKVYRALSNISTVSGLTPIYAGTTNWTTDTLNANGTYWYAVVASNSSGDSVPSNSVNVSVQIPPAGNITSKWGNGVTFTLYVGVQEVIITSSDGNTILVEISLNVTATVQMTVTVSTTNPTSSNLAGGVAYFSFAVSAESFNQISAKFYYSSSGMTSDQEQQLTTYLLDSSGSWTDIGGTPNLDNHCVTTDLPHLSTYAVAPVTSTSANNSGMTSIIILISILGVAAIVGIVLLVKLRKASPKAETSVGGLNLDWDW